MQIAKSCNHKRPCYDDGKCHFTKPCEHQYLTNADRIRSMSDEELAEWLVDANMCERVCIEEDYCGCDVCVNRVTDWLKQPAKEEHHEDD